MTPSHSTRGHDLPRGLYRKSACGAVNLGLDHPATCSRSAPRRKRGLVADFASQIFREALGRQIAATLRERDLPMISLLSGSACRTGLCASSRCRKRLLYKVRPS